MKSIIEQLWYGNVDPDTNSRKSTKEIKELMEYIARHYDTLQSTLTAEQNEVLEKFDDCRTELTDINEREIFVYAFKLGARFALEVVNLEEYK